MSIFQKKCSQCEYASSVASNLRKYLKMHNGEKSNKEDFQTLGKLNKCNQFDFVFSEASNLRKRLKTHNGEKSNKEDFQTLGELNKCNQFEASNLRRGEEEEENKFIETRICNVHLGYVTSKRWQYQNS